MWKPLMPAAFVACLVISPIYATQRADLPATAPRPQSRPEAQAAEKSARHLPPVEILSSPQSIPRARLQVRVIGASFLPSAEPVDFAAGIQAKEPVVIRFVETALSATIHGSWNAKPAADAPTAIASND